jgi:hypothetical protein
MDDLNNNDANGDYYFYVSHTNKMKIAKNSLTKAAVETEPILSITGNFITELGEIIITAWRNTLVCPTVPRRWLDPASNCRAR